MQIKLNASKTYCLACSFGPDSMALFHLLLTNHYSFIVAHVNYKMRGKESDLETTNLIHYCQEKNIPCYVEYIDGKDIKGNFQKEAREFRYQFFAKVAKSHSFDVLLTAHHLDDHLETYLMQKASKRQNFHYGIAKEAQIAGLYVQRPLLNFTKKQLLEYNLEHQVPFGNDSSNDDKKYSRNKIRHEIINKMSNDEKEDINNFITELNIKQNLIYTKLLPVLKDNKFEFKTFKSLEESQKPYFIYLLFQSSGIDANFSLNRFKSIDQIIENKQTSSLTKLFGSYYFVKYEEKGTIIDLENYKPYSLVVDSPQTIVHSRFTAFLDRKESLPFINIDQYPITITTALPHDKYQIKGYVKLINRMYIDMKMPRHYRLFWPVIKNNRGEVVFVPRYRQGYISKQTDLLKINLP